jgi:hypothetical protein
VAGLLLGVSLVSVVLVGIVGLIVETPFTLLGYWAHGGSQRPPDTTGRTP